MPRVDDFAEDLSQPFFKEVWFIDFYAHIHLVFLYLGCFFIMISGAAWLSRDDHSIVVVNSSPSLHTCRIKNIKYT